MRRLLAGVVLVAAAFAPAGPATALEPCQTGRTQVMCQSGHCDPEGGCLVYPCVVWTKNTCVPFVR